MANNSLAAAELFVFLGLAGWLLYYQFTSSSRRDGDHQQPPKDPVDTQDAKEDA
ncbi:hypothetical protein [Thiocystis violascens]|uniref:Uncharacterized protein n=1 Tax=Thiocystis violascens (strain ATCC 17096 / DSM 198 / 6111) TaxID=765911 RepID=I3YE94_THIV6|nr:hypothetical protein [Thiocystis violascens]AFL75312.1 hypothetical protein Thivi_3442 [Thiocystis violascens DSM 198]